MIITAIKDCIFICKALLLQLGDPLRQEIKSPNSTLRTARDPICVHVDLLRQTPGPIADRRNDSLCQRTLKILFLQLLVVLFCRPPGLFPPWMRFRWAEGLRVVLLR